MSFRSVIVLEKDRICHVERLGSRLDDRIIGALAVYVGLDEPVTVQFQDEQPRTGRVVAVEPYRRHRIAVGRQYACTILVEPESVTDDCLRELIDDMNGIGFGEDRLARFLDGLIDIARDPDSLGDRYGRTSFDRLIFDRDLLPRRLDRRIAKVTDLVETRSGPQDRSDSYARELTLSASHFLRLFRETTGVQFRLYRMWKRARSWLHHIRTDAPLTQIALDLGYPDSTHFSHSIRQTYGLPPRDMKSFMRHSTFLTERARDHPATDGGSLRP